MSVMNDMEEEMYQLRITIDNLKQQRESLITNATRSVSWIDGVIEILELFRPETPSQQEWKKQMVAEGYAIIQGHVEVAMLEDESVNLREQRDEWKAEAIYLRGLSAETVAGQELAIVKQQRDELLAAAENLVKVKGRHHTEQAYKQLEASIAKVKEQK